MPKVSICIPTYNNADEAARLLRSVREQTYTDYEVVITDDSTGTEIAELVRGLADDRIRYVHNEEKLGHIYNWNAAIEKAEGDYVKIMFSDDWFTYPDSLYSFVKMLDDHPEAGFAFSNSMQVSEEESYQRVVSEDFIPRLREDWRHIFLGNEIGAPSDTIYRRNGVRFDEQSNWASDLELYLHLLKDNPCFASTDRPLISIGLHAEQYTHTFSRKDDRIFNDYLLMYRKYQLWENERCREFFLKEYIIKYGKGISVAKSCKIGTAAYFKAKSGYLFGELLPCYIRAAGRKLGVRKTE